LADLWKNTNPLIYTSKSCFLFIPRDPIYIMLYPVLV
jgi:hypothetical protein